MGYSDIACLFALPLGLSLQRFVGCIATVCVAALPKELPAKEKALEMPSKEREATFLFPDPPQREQGVLNFLSIRGHKRRE